MNWPGPIERLWVRLLRRNQYESITLRDFFRRRHNIEVGLYSFGMFDARRVPSGTVFGRYCSISDTARFIDADHPIHSFTTHPVGYLPQLGVVISNPVKAFLKVIEDDVWIGHGAVILSGCRVIGRGSVIAAGAVVTRDVAPYSIVAGNPAKHVRARFSDEVIAALEESEWWLLEKAELARRLKYAPEILSEPTTASIGRFSAA